MRPNKTLIKKALAEGAFDPNNRETAMYHVAQAGNIEYPMRRAIECVGEALTSRSDKDYYAQLDRALSMIALAKILRRKDDGSRKIKKPQTGTGSANSSSNSSDAGK